MTDDTINSIPCVTCRQSHDWAFVPDWEGDPRVVNGIHDVSHWECKRCGLESVIKPEIIE